MNTGTVAAKKVMFQTNKNGKLVTGVRDNLALLPLLSLCRSQMLLSVVAVDVAVAAVTTTDNSNNKNNHDNNKVVQPTCAAFAVDYCNGV